MSRVVRYSRMFVQRIIAESKKGESPDSWITLSGEVKKDFYWWRCFLVTFNGISYIPSRSVAAHLLGDACLTGGSGIIQPTPASSRSVGLTFKISLAFLSTSLNSGA